MPRPRTNDPSNLSTKPNITTNSVRQSELLTEYLKRVKFLSDSYAVSKHLFADKKTFNRSLTKLKRALVRKRILKNIGKRLHPELEAPLSYLARKLAEADGVQVDETHIRAAGQRLVETLKPRRGRPDNPMLEHHVAGLMALVHEFSGLPVLSLRDKNSVYDPQFPNGISQTIPVIVKTWDEDIATTQLVNIVRKIRQKYAGKPLHFLELFPGYGALVKNGEAVMSSGMLVERLDLNIPTYCP